MRAWRLAMMPLRCGLEGCAIAPGEPYLELAGPTWRKARCRSCAGEPVNQAQAQASIAGPANLRGNLLVPTFAAVGTLARDFKQKASGE